MVGRKNIPNPFIRIFQRIYQKMGVDVANGSTQWSGFITCSHLLNRFSGSPWKSVAASTLRRYFGLHLAIAQTGAGPAMPIHLS